MNWRIGLLVMGGFGQLLTLVEYSPMVRWGVFKGLGTTTYKPGPQRPELWARWIAHKGGIILTAFSFWLQIILL